MNVGKIIHDLFAQEKPTGSPEEFWAAGGCLAFPGKVAMAITGRDPTEAVRGQFRSEAEATRLMAENGCASLHDVALRAFAEIPVALARPGDWAIVANEGGGEGLGVVVGSQIAVRTPISKGLVLRSRATSAYRVE